MNNKIEAYINKMDFYMGILGVILLLGFIIVVGQNTLNNGIHESSTTISIMSTEQPQKLNSQVGTNNSYKLKTKANFNNMCIGNPAGYDKSHYSIKLTSEQLFLINNAKSKGYCGISLTINNSQCYISFEELK